MSLDPGTQYADLAATAYQGGKLGDDLIQAIFACIKRNQPAVRSIANLLTRTIVDATGTATQIKGGAGFVYRVRVANGSTDKVIVQLLDSTIVRASLFCGAGTADTSNATRSHAEAVWATDNQGAGTEFDTNIKLKAVLASDGTTTAAANVHVTVDWN